MIMDKYMLSNLAEQKVYQVESAGARKSCVGATRQSIECVNHNKKMRVACVCVLLLLGLSAHAKPSSLPSSKVTSPEINEYIDAVLQEVKKLVITLGLEPMQLPDLIREFEWTDLLGITWKGEASLKNGWLLGLLNLFRDGDVDMNYGEFLLHVGGRMSFSDLQMDYDFTTVFMGIGPEGTAMCTVKNAKIDFEYDMHLASLVSNITVFEISDVGNINCQIRGVGAGWNFVLEILVNLFIDVVQDTALRLLSETMRELMQQALDNIGGFNPNSTVALAQPVPRHPLPYRLH